MEITSEASFSRVIERLFSSTVLATFCHARSNAACSRPKSSGPKAPGIVEARTRTSVRSARAKFPAIENCENVAIAIASTSRGRGAPDITLSRRRPLLRAVGTITYAEKCPESNRMKKGRTEFTADLHVRDKEAGRSRWSSSGECDRLFLPVRGAVPTRILKTLEQRLSPFPVQNGRDRRSNKEAFHSKSLGNGDGLNTKPLNRRVG